MDTRTDAELLRDADGHSVAFEAFVARHQPSLLRYVTRRLGPSEVEDVVNETFAIAYARRETYDRTRPDARPWLFGIATNLIRRHTRREAQALRAYARSGSDPVAPDAPRAPLDPTVAGALAALRPRYRDVLFLRAVADLSHDEIAVALEVPVGTARAWLSRARAAAAKELEARGVVPSSSPADPDPKAIES